MYLFILMSYVFIKIPFAGERKAVQLCGRDESGCESVNEFSQAHGGSCVLFAPRSLEPGQLSLRKQTSLIAVN